MGQESSQIEGKPLSDDAVIIKRDPEEKENEHLRDVSNWESSVAKERLSRNGTIKTPERRLKKRRRPRSSSSSKAAFGTAKDRLDIRPLGDSRDTRNLPQPHQETAQTNGIDGTLSSVAGNPRKTDMEAKKRRLLAVVSAAAGDINNPYSDVESDRHAESTGQAGADDTDQGSQTGASAKPVKKIRRPGLIAKRSNAEKVNGHWSSEAIQGTKDSSTSRQAKNMQSKSRLASTSLATNGGDELATGLQLLTPEDSSQIHGRQLLEDPFTTHNSRQSQIAETKHNRSLRNKVTAARHMQQLSSLEKLYTDEDISDEEDGSVLREPHPAEKTSDSHQSISPLGLQPNANSIGRTSFDPAMDFIDPALRNIGADPNHLPQQIGVYRDVATPQSTEKRKRRLPVDEDVHGQTLGCEPKTKRPRKQILKSRTRRNSNRKSLVRDFRDESPDVDLPSKKAKRRSTRKKVATHEPMAKGKFNKEELDIIENEIIKYREMSGTSMVDLNQTIQDNPSKLGSLWDEICEALPDRPRTAIVKVCRRKYHNFGVRGKWTKEEDRELKETYERFPKRWKQIGQVLNRHHEDVRDRWRNYIVCGDSMKREQWTEEEEDNLRAVVGECIQAVRELKAAEIARNPGMIHDPRPDIELIDWQIVSEKFGRTRSRLQCLDKWNRLARIEDSEGGSKELEFGPNSWRVKSAYKDIKNMRREDYLELLIALRNSHAGREGKVNWAKLGDLDLRIKWTCMARKVAWKKLRASVPGNEQMKFQDIVTLLLNNLPENDAQLEGADVDADAVPGSPFGDIPSPQKRSLSEAISSAEEDENDNIDPNLNDLAEGDFDPDDFQEYHDSVPLNQQTPNVSRDMLHEVVGEGYFDIGNTDEEDEDGDMAMADHGSVDLSGPHQQMGAGRRVSRLRSPISFKVASLQEPEYVNGSTHSDEDDVDMDIPARRPVESFRLESVDLDMN